MIYNDHHEKKSINNRKTEALIISLLLVILVLFYFFVFLFFYLPYSKEIVEMYSNSPYLTLTSIVIILRIIISIYLAGFFINKWISRRIRNYFNMPFLLCLFFYIFILAKLLDLVFDATYCIIRTNNNDVFSNLFLLNLAKFRYSIAVLNILPIFLLGFYLYTYGHSLDKENIIVEKLTKRKTLIFSLLYIVIFLTIIILLPTIMLFALIALSLSMTSITFLIWVFFTAYKGKILPNINSRIIGIGFSIFLIFNAGFPIILYSIGQISIQGEGITGLTVESGALFSFIIILIGFKTEASYGIKIKLNSG